jgi:serine/threonine protein phosphatase PrpC
MRLVSFVSSFICCFSGYQPTNNQESPFTLQQRYQLSTAPFQSPSSIPGLSTTGYQTVPPYPSNLIASTPLANVPSTTRGFFQSPDTANYLQIQQYQQQQQQFASSADLAFEILQAAQDTAKAKISLTTEEFDARRNVINCCQKYNESKLKAYLTYDSSLSVTRLCDMGNLAADGQTPLHVAASFGSIPALKLLLEMGDPSITTIWIRDLQGRTPLHLAAEGGHVEACQFLRQKMKEEKGVDPVGVNAPIDLGGTTPLGWAKKKYNGRPTPAKPTTKTVIEEDGKEKEEKLELDSLLFQRGDASILQSTPYAKRIGKSPWKSSSKKSSFFSPSTTTVSSMIVPSDSYYFPSSSTVLTPPAVNSFPAAASASSHSILLSPTSSAKDNLIYAFSEAQGWTPKMEDRMVVLCPIPMKPQWSFFAVLDGHGGSFSSNYLASLIPSLLNDIVVEYEQKQQSQISSSSSSSSSPNPSVIDSLETPEMLTLLLTDLCKKADEELSKHPRMKVKILNNGTLNIKDSSGSTAIMVLMTTYYIAIGNIGDSRAVLGKRSIESREKINDLRNDPFALAKDNNSNENSNKEGEESKVSPQNHSRRSSRRLSIRCALEAAPLSRDHKANIPEERERILKADAQLVFPLLLLPSSYTCSSCCFSLQNKSCQWRRRIRKCSL